MKLLISFAFIAIIFTGCYETSSCDCINEEELEMDVVFSVEKYNFEYEVSDTNGYTIMVSKSGDTINLVDYWAMIEQPANMEVFAESVADTLIISYADTSSFGDAATWMPTVKTTASIVFESGIDEINFVKVNASGGRGPYSDEDYSYRIADVDTVLVLE
jgi:hypothetical protein